MSTQRIMTQKELSDWRHGEWVAEFSSVLPVQVDGVWFGRSVLSVSFRYKNSQGLIFPDNGYLGPQPDGKDYYPLLKLSCRHSDECRFNPSGIPPDIHSVAEAIKKSWEDFTK